MLAESWRPTARHSPGSSSARWTVGSYVRSGLRRFRCPNQARSCTRSPLRGRGDTSTGVHAACSKRSAPGRVRRIAVGKYWGARPAPQVPASIRRAAARTFPAPLERAKVSSQRSPRASQKRSRGSDLSIDVTHGKQKGNQKGLPGSGKCSPAAPLGTRCGLPAPPHPPNRHPDAATPPVYCAAAGSSVRRSASCPPPPNGSTG